MTWDSTCDIDSDGISGVIYRDSVGATSSLLSARVFNILNGVVLHAACFADRSAILSGSTLLQLHRLRGNGAS